MIMEEENSVISSPAATITEGDTVSEESGWTKYIDDFTAYKDGGSYSYMSGSDSYMSGSMVSDAGSGPEWKNNNININNNINKAGLCGGTISVAGLLPNMPKRLNFKKKIPFDDSLEDTASSPVNSPKITAYFNRMDINSKKMENKSGCHKGDEMSIDKRVEYKNLNRENGFKENFGNNNNVECMELKQKGLCLVPVQMVLNYLGR